MTDHTNPPEKVLYMGGSFRVIDPNHLTAYANRKGATVFHAPPTAYNKYQGFRTFLSHRQELP